MAEIGATLREARTRARIEIAQMEAQTKIRAKYLRALENEEWELLPGPTYVKSFLKTYGDMLGLDGRQLVADYKRQHEPFQIEGDIGQLSKHSGGRMNRQQKQGAPLRTLALGALAVAVLAGAAYVFVLDGDDEPAASTPAESVGGSTPADDAAGGEPATGAKRVRVAVSATGDVRVCLRVGTSVKVKDKALESGDKSRTVSGSTVIVTAIPVGSSKPKARLVINGESRALPSDAPAGNVTLSVTSTGVAVAGSAVTACQPPT